MRGTRNTAESFINASNMTDDGLLNLIQVLKLVDDRDSSVGTVVVLMFSQFVTLSSNEGSITIKRLTMLLTRYRTTNRR